MKHLVTVIDWYGPYNLDEAIRVAKEEIGEGLYLCLGLRKHQKHYSRVQYVGIAGSDISTRLRDPNHKIHRVTREQRFFLGEVSSLGIPGKKAKATNPKLDFAEWALVYFVAPELNVKKTVKPPKRPVTVLNRWWRADGETQYVKRPHEELPDLIDYLGPGIKARMVWFSRPVRVEV